MSTQEQPHELTVDELVEKWTRVGELVKKWTRVGELVKKWKLVGAAAEEVPIELMPPWADICFCPRSIMRWIRAGSSMSGPFKKKNFGYSGVYRLYGVTSEGGGVSCIINRVCGADHTGTLYIGCARRLSDRLNGLRRALLKGYGSHHVPELLKFYRRLHQDFPPNKLRVALYACRNCKRVESDLIDAYINSFGEMPPLNERLGSRWLSDE